MRLSRETLLLLAGVLVIVRFAVVPLQQRQTTQFENHALLAQQLNKAERQVDGVDALRQALADQLQREQEWAAAFPTAPSSGQFRVVVQQQIQQLIAANSLQLTLFEWLTQQRSEEQTIQTHQVRITLQGADLAIMAWMLQLAETLPALKVVNFEFRQPPRPNRQGERPVTLTLLADVTGWIGELPTGGGQ